MFGVGNCLRSYLPGGFFRQLAGLLHSSNNAGKEPGLSRLGPKVSNLFLRIDISSHKCYNSYVPSGNEVPHFFGGALPAKDMTRAERRRKKAQLNNNGRNKSYLHRSVEHWGGSKADFKASDPPEGITPAAPPRRTPGLPRRDRTAAMITPRPVRNQGRSSPFDGSWAEMPAKAVFFGR